MASVSSIFEQDAVPEAKRWRVEQFLRFYESGELGSETEHFELLDGEILKKLGQNEPHIVSLRLAAAALRKAFGSGFDVSQQIPITLAEFNRPEPDLTVLKGDPRDFDGRPATPANVALLIEVVDSRMDTALAQKVPIYAQHGVAEYWIIDLRRRVVEVRTGPIPASTEWTTTRRYSEADSITPIYAPDAAIPVADLLPRAELP